MLVCFMWLRYIFEFGVTPPTDRKVSVLTGGHQPAQRVICAGSKLLVVVAPASKDRL
jgi:hypothetical protein